MRPLVNRHISSTVKAHAAPLVSFRAVEREWSIRAWVLRASDWLHVTRLKINIFRTVRFYVFALWAGAKRYRRMVTQRWTKVVVCRCHNNETAWNFSSPCPKLHHKQHPSVRLCVVEHCTISRKCPWLLRLSSRNDSRNSVVGRGSHV